MDGSQTGEEATANRHLHLPPSSAIMSISDSPSPPTDRESAADDSLRRAEEGESRKEDGKGGEEEAGSALAFSAGDGSQGQDEEMEVIGTEGALSKCSFYVSIYAADGDGEAGQGERKEGRKEGTDGAARFGLVLQLEMALSMRPQDSQTDGLDDAD